MSKEPKGDSRGAWTKEVDDKLRSLVHGQTNISSIKWRAIAPDMQMRNSKQCAPSAPLRPAPSCPAPPLSRLYSEVGSLESCTTNRHVARHVARVYRCRERWLNHLDPRVRRAPPEKTHRAHPQKSGCFKPRLVHRFVRESGLPRRRRYSSQRIAD